jgi:TolB protein
MPSGRRTQKELCLVHPFFSRDDFPVRVLVNKGHNFAPRWHKTRPVIYYAHHTPTNIRLMSIDAGKQVHIITDFDGQNLTPAFAPDGKIVMALSIKNFVQLFLYHFDEQTKKSKFTQLTYEKGDCISPSFITHDTLVFSKVDEHNQPELGIFTLSTKKVKWLPVGHAMCPMASPDGNLIAYCKKVGGVGQVCIYELSTGKERQLTHDSGYKDECSWSPCGNYITCSVESGTKSRIAIIPVATGHVQFITPANEHWSSPCWSPQLVLPFAFK